MQNALRKWLVGFGLVAALLALAVPALAQNTWQAQVAPVGTFPTPVTAMTVGPLNQVEAVTAGGGYPGGVLGSTYYDNAGGTNFVMRSGAGQPPANPTGDDYTAVAWDTTYWYGGSWVSGLWVWDGLVFTNPTATAPLWVNKHVQCFAVDVDNAGAPDPHVLYIGSWGDGVYSFDGTTWTKLANYPGAAPSQFVRKIMLVSNGAGVHPTIYAGTDGNGIVKGTWTGATWNWSTVFTTDGFITALGQGGGYIYAGTRTMGIYSSNDGGATWNPMTSSPVITTAVSAVIATPIGFFVGTEGQGIYRWDGVTSTWYRIDTAGCVGSVAVDPYINDLAFETATTTLFAGAGQQVAAATGHVYSIAFANPTTAEPATRALQVGTYDNHTLSVIPPATCSPTNWKAQITSGGLPPGMALVVDNPPTIGAPAVRVVGTPTADCSYPVTIRVWDALFNYVDISYTSIVQLMTPGIYINTTPTPLGTVMAFSTDSPATLGVTGSINYHWNFGDGAAFPAVDSTSATPTHIYSAPGSYTVTLWISDSACLGVPPANVPPNDCTLTSAPDSCNQTTADVYSSLTVDPNATIVGSGSQFQFHPNVLGGLPSCGPYVAPLWGYNYDWRFYLGVAPAPAIPPSSTPPPGWIAQSNLSDPIETFTSTGNFWAWLHVTDCSGHDAYGYVVVNYNGPMSVTLSSNTNPAPTGYTVFFEGTALGGGVFANYTFDFDFGDGSPILMGQPPTLVVPVPTFIPSHIYAAAGNYTVVMTAHDDPAPPGGHTTVIQMIQQIYTAFTAVNVTRTTTDCVAGYPNGPVTKSVCFNVSPVGGLPPYLLSVDWGDGSTSTFSGLTAFPYSICHSYTVANSYTPTFYLTDSGHIAITQSTTNGPFFLGNPLAGHVTPACQQVLSPANATWTIYNDTVLSTGFAATDYRYYFGYGDGNVTGWTTFAGASAVVNYNYGGVPGHYQPYWYLYNLKNCEQIGPFYGLDVYVYTPLAPLAAPTWVQSCGSRTVTFTASVPTTGVPPYTYKWDFGDATLPYTTNVPTTTHTFAANGNYNAQLTVNDSVGNPGVMCGTGAHQTQNVIYLVQVVEPISGTIAGPSGNVGCAVAGPLHYTSAMAGGALIAPVPPFQPNPALNYTWSVSPPTGVVIATPNAWQTDITFNNPGTYTISLSVSSISVPTYICSATNTIIVTVIGGLSVAPAPNFIVTETSGYLPLPDTFTSTYAVTDPSADVTITYTFLKNGVPYMFPVTDPPTTQPGVFTAPNIYTIHPTTPFMNNTFTFVESGTYTVTMQASDTCGTSTPSVVRVIQILEPPALSVTTQATPANGNAPLTVVFSSFPTGGVPQAGTQYIYDWNFGDATPHSSQQNPTHIYAAPGVYTATLTVTDFYPVPVPPGIRHTATASVTVTVYAGMTVVASASTPTSGSKPLTVDFLATPTGGNGVYSYFWYFGDGATSTLQNPTHIYSTAGTYFAYVVVNDTASHTATSNQVVVNVYDPLVVTANATPTNGVVPFPVSFSAAANGGDNNYTYTWNFGDGSPTATGALVNHTYTVAGATGTVYTVTLTVVDGVGHSATKILTVTAYRAMTAAITAAHLTGFTPFNPGLALAAPVTGGDGTYTYLWNFGDGTSSNLAAPTKTYATAGSYAVWLTVTDGAGHSVVSNTINLVAWAPLAVTLAATPTSGTKPLAVTFTAVATGGDGVYTYSFNYGDGTGTSPNHTYTTAGTYTASVTVTDNSSHTATSNNVTITVWDPMAAIITVTPHTGLIPFTPSFSVTATGGTGTYTYLWTFGDGTTSTAAAPSKTYTTAGNYTVYCQVTDTASHTVISNSITLTVWAPVTLAASANPALLIGPGTITFTANAAGGDGNYTVNWNFGDGHTGTGTTVNHTYAVGTPPNFTYTVTVTVTDGVGGTGHTATQTLTVTVRPVPPTILQAIKLIPPAVPSWRLKLLGTNFQSGCVATINGTAVVTTYKNGGEIILKDCKSLCPRGVPVTIVVTNPDGGISANFTYIRTQNP